MALELVHDLDVSCLEKDNKKSLRISVCVCV